MDVKTSGTLRGLTLSLSILLALLQPARAQTQPQDVAGMDALLAWTSTNGAAPPGWVQGVDPCGTTDVCCSLPPHAFSSSAGGSMLISSNTSISLNGSSSVPPCAWSGICCVDSHVTVLDLSCGPEGCSRQLQGALPAAGINMLAQLYRLNLSGHALSGGLSAVMWRQLSIKDLDLSWNDFHGALPNDGGFGVGLQNLSLSHNSFSGGLPDRWGELRTLQYVRLAGNRLSGSLPTSWMALVGNLQLLDLCDNCGLCGWNPGIPSPPLDARGTGIGYVCVPFLCSTRDWRPLIIGVAISAACAILLSVAYTFRYHILRVNPYLSGWAQDYYRSRGLVEMSLGVTGDGLPLGTPRRTRRRRRHKIQMLRLVVDVQQGQAYLQKVADSPRKPASDGEAEIIDGALSPPQGQLSETEDERGWSPYQPSVGARRSNRADDRSRSRPALYEGLTYRQHYNGTRGRRSGRRRRRRSHPPAYDAQLQQAAVRLTHSQYQDRSLEGHTAVTVSVGSSDENPGTQVHPQRQQQQQQQQQEDSSSTVTPLPSHAAQGTHSRHQQEHQQRYGRGLSHQPSYAAAGYPTAGSQGAVEPSHVLQSVVVIGGSSSSSGPSMQVGSSVPGPMGHTSGDLQQQQQPGMQSHAQRPGLEWPQPQVPPHDGGGGRGGRLPVSREPAGPTASGPIAAAAAGGSSQDTAVAGGAPGLVGRARQVAGYLIPAGPSRWWWSAGRRDQGAGGAAPAAAAGQEAGAAEGARASGHVLPSSLPGQEQQQQQPLSSSLQQQAASVVPGADFSGQHQQQQHEQQGHGQYEDHKGGEGGRRHEAHDEVVHLPGVDLVVLSPDMEVVDFAVRDPAAAPASVAAFGEQGSWDAFVVVHSLRPATPTPTPTLPASTASAASGNTGAMPVPHAQRQQRWWERYRQPSHQGQPSTAPGLTPGPAGPGPGNQAGSTASVQGHRGPAPSVGAAGTSAPGASRASHTLGGAASAATAGVGHHSSPFMVAPAVAGRRSLQLQLASRAPSSSSGGGGASRQSSLQHYYQSQGQAMPATAAGMVLHLG